MSATVLRPRTGDRPRVPVGGSLLVTIFYDYSAASDLTAHVDTDYAPATGNPLSGSATVAVMVPISKVAGTYANTPVQAKTGGVLEHTQTVALTVTPVTVTLSAARVGSPAARRVAGSGAIQYCVSGDIDPNTAYVVCVAHELTANPADTPDTVDGVFCDAGAGLTWAGLVTIPNNPGRAYIARVIQFDANDNVLDVQTEILD